MSLALVTASGSIKAGRLVIRDRKAFDSAISGLRDGLDVEIEVSRLRATRSQKQNAFYWGVVLAALADHTGYNMEELHDLMKAKFLPKHLAFTDGNGEVVESFVLGGSTRDLSTIEFNDYMERIRQWAGESLAVYIPTPDEHGYGI